MPASPVEHEDGMDSGRNGSRDFRKMRVHRLRVGMWDDQRGGLGALVLPA
ncbi:hypothetical protein [Roseovarius sp. SYSU LYC5161]